MDSQILNYLVGYLTLASLDSPYLVNISGIPGYGYYAVLGLGEPAQKLHFLLDTGSSNLAVATDRVSAITRWFNEKSSQTLMCSDLRQTVRYQQGVWSGKLCTDQITLFGISSGSSKRNVELNVQSQISLIDVTSDFFPSFNTSSVWEGILGLGFARLFAKSSPNSWINAMLFHPKWAHAWTTLFPLQSGGHSLFDDLVLHLAVPNHFSFLLCGLTQNCGYSNRASGVWELGTPIFNKSAASHGQIFFTPIQRAWFYEVVLTDLRIVNQSVVHDCMELNFDKTIVDTGTTNIELPERVFTSVLNHVKRHFYYQCSLRNIYPGPFAKFWRGKSPLCENTTSKRVGGTTGLPYTLFPTMEFYFEETPVDGGSGTTFVLSLSPQQYIRYLGRTFKHGQLLDCFTFGIEPNRLGTVLGLAFLEGFFTVFDRDSLQVGFSDSTCNRYSNLSSVAVSQVLGYQKGQAPTGHTVPISCAFHGPVLSPVVENANWTCFFVILFSIVEIFVIVSVRCFIKKYSP